MSEEVPADWDTNTQGYYGNRHSQAWYDYYWNLSDFKKTNMMNIAPSVYVGAVGLGLGSALMLLPKTGKIGKVTKQTWWPYAGTFLVTAGAFYLTAGKYGDYDTTLIGIPSASKVSSTRQSIARSYFINKMRYDEGLYNSPLDILPTARYTSKFLNGVF